MDRVFVCSRNPSSAVVGEMQLLNGPPGICKLPSALWCVSQASLALAKRGLDGRKEAVQVPSESVLKIWINLSNCTEGTGASSILGAERSPLSRARHGPPEGLPEGALRCRLREPGIGFGSPQFRSFVRTAQKKTQHKAKKQQLHSRIPGRGFNHENSDILPTFVVNAGSFMKVARLFLLHHGCHGAFWDLVGHLEVGHSAGVEESHISALSDKDLGQRRGSLKLTMHAWMLGRLSKYFQVQD